MEDIRTRPLSALEGITWQVWLPQALVLVYLLIALVTFLIIPFLALDWMKLPFMGGFVEQTMMIDNMGPTQRSVPWAAYQQGLRFGDQLVRIDGQPVSSARDIRAALQGHAVGEQVTAQVRTRQGELRDFTLPLTSLPFGDQLSYFYFPYLIGLIYLGSAVWVFSVRRVHPSGRSFAAFAVSVGLAMALIFDLFTTHCFSALWTLAVAMIGGSVISLALTFPREAYWVRRWPALSGVGLVIGALLALYSTFQLYNTAQPAAYADGWRLEYMFVGASVLFLLGYNLYARQRMSSPIEREQMRMMNIASLISFVPMGAWMLIAAVFQTVFTPYLFLPLAVFPVVAGYTVQRYRMLQADYILGRGLQIGLMAVLVSVGYALLTAGFGLALGQVLSPDSPLFAGLAFFLLAMLFHPLRENSMHLIDKIFFRGKRAFQDRLQTFSGELTRMVDLPNIQLTLRRSVEETLAPSQLHIFLYDSLSDQYVAAPDGDGKPTSDLRFPTFSGLVIRLGDQRAPLVLSEFDGLPPMLEPDRPRLMLLGAQAFIPLPGRQRLAGWLALGPRFSGEPYTSQQVAFLEALCDQAALAIERAQVVANMEKRVREMNVLTRVAQGVNITLNLDDILELVYAQTLQVIPAEDFHIMLYEREGDLYHFVFYLENEDRVSSQENTPVQPGQALEQEVIRQGRPLLTDDYNRDCQQRAILNAKPGLFAWLGVPLNTGAETIGALSVGRSDPTLEYTPEQQNLLQAIADQVAGAIVKASLLQESERRARQLTTLNEVTRQLTSTLEIEPLLQSILQSAVDILDCEAGNLLLLDAQSDELVYRSAAGAAGAGQLNRRISAERGAAGKAVKAREAVIVNDVSRYPEWFPAGEKPGGLLIRAVLAIPLIVKDRVIGVIEALNKREGIIFSKNDVDLLAAFASQAAVAMENARMYTLTDQALAARVEELSVMQRIDRELNTSLDTTRAMRITLEWAMRQSGARAGLVGVLHDEDSSSPAGIQIMASQGYDGELDPYQMALLPVKEYQLAETLEGGLPLRRTINNDSELKGLLADGRSQAILPIRRETTTIGLLLLESGAEGVCSEERMNFLVRLSDHASIAISNAQLYTEVQQANLAKSDFVSFVAHELKNPMTSVKGYTELISAGAVGPVTDVQANFLGTIRANIERMNTLVSDLNDMSKIEVGRLRLDFKAVALPEALEEVVRSIRKQMDEKQQELVMSIPADLPQIWADRVRLVQVLVNLVSNAHKYTPENGSVEIAAERCANQWDPNGAAEVVHIWVKDNGIGINEEDQKKIFQKFFRSDDPKTREVTGTGLGLNITKSLIEMQGGRIWFESAYRKGTTFHFTVPLSE